MTTKTSRGTLVGGARFKRDLRRLLRGGGRASYVARRRFIPQRERESSGAAHGPMSRARVDDWEGTPKGALLEKLRCASVRELRPRRKRLRRGSGILTPRGARRKSHSMASHAIRRRSSPAVKASRARRAHAAKLSNGLVLWAGPSWFTGAPVVVIVTGVRRKSKNPKTGAMLQVWILPVRGRVMPRGLICGWCPLGRSLACYVSWAKAPLSVRTAYLRSRYPRATAEQIAALGRGEYGPIRAGAAGDPAAVPTEVWASIRPTTGYTHAWEARPELRAWLMASVESEADALRAQAAGWRTFRVTREGEAPMAREIECASTARGMSCADCKACNGIGPNAMAAQDANPERERATRRVSLRILVHGAGASKMDGPVVNRSMMRAPV